MVVDESLLQAQQSTYKVGTQVVRHAVVKHEFLLITVARREIQLTAKDGWKNVKLLRVRRDGAQAQGRRSIVHQTTAASGCTVLFKIQRERWCNPYA